MHCCPKKKYLPPDQWFNPEYATEKAEEKNGTTSVVTAQCLEQEHVSSDNESIMVFSGTQTIRFTDEYDPEVIRDSG